MAPMIDQEYSVCNQKTCSSGQLDDGMIAKDGLFTFQISNRDEQPFIAVDPELNIKTRLALARGWIGMQEGRTVFINPEVGAPILVIGGDPGDSGGAGRIKDQFHGWSNSAGPALSQLEDGKAELGLAVVGGFHGHARQRLARGIRRAARNDGPVVVVVLLRIDEADGIIVLDVVVEIDAGNEGGGAAGHGVERAIQHYAVAAEDALYGSLYRRHHAGAANQQHRFDALLVIAALAGIVQGPPYRVVHLRKGLVLIKQILKLGT